MHPLPYCSRALACDHSLHRAAPSWPHEQLCLQLQRVRPTRLLACWLASVLQPLGGRRAPAAPPTSSSTVTIVRAEGTRSLRNSACTSHKSHIDSYLVAPQRGAPVGLSIDIQREPHREPLRELARLGRFRAFDADVIVPVGALVGPSAEEKPGRRRVDQLLAIRPDRRRLAMRRAKFAVVTSDASRPSSRHAAFHGS